MNRGGTALARGGAMVYGGSLEARVGEGARVDSKAFPVDASPLVFNSTVARKYYERVQPISGRWETLATSVKFQMLANGTPGRMYDFSGSKVMLKYKYRPIGFATTRAPAPLATTTSASPWTTTAPAK